GALAQRVHLEGWAAGVTMLAFLAHRSRVYPRSALLMHKSAKADLCVRDASLRDAPHHEAEIGLPHPRLRRELRAAQAHLSAWVLPQLLAGMQLAERARDGAEVVGRKPLRDVGVVERLLLDRLRDLLRQRLHLVRIAGLTGLVGLAVDVVVDLGVLRIRI